MSANETTTSAKKGGTKGEIEREADFLDILSYGVPKPKPDSSEMLLYRRGIADGLRRALYLLGRED